MINVRYGTVQNIHNHTSGWLFTDFCDLGWRVRIDEKPLMLAFASERDATAGMNTLIANGITDRTAAIEAGPDKVRRLLVENLQW